MERKIESMLKTVARLFRGERAAQLHPCCIIDLEEGYTVFSRDLHNLADPGARNSIMTALLEAERRKAEALELARRLSLR